MTTTTVAPATTPPALDLDARLALRSALMDERIAHASAAIEINTAHIPIDPIPHIDAPPLIAPSVVPCPYTTPAATTLWQARIILEQRGWCRGNLTDTDGAVCLMGAVETAAAGSSHVHDALGVLLEAIRREFPEAQSVPNWNDHRGNPFLVCRFLDQAAELAHNRNL